MAKLYIEEYSLGTRDVKGIAQPIAMEPSLVEQTAVVIGGGSLQSAAFNAETNFVRIHTDAICSVKFGANPTATVNSKRMSAGATEYFGVTPGQKVAVIANT